MDLIVSKGNSKMGSIPSVSLPPEKTCLDYPCKNICYARKISRLRPAVKNSYENNYNLLISDPDEYWKEIDGIMKLSRYFRYHVAGDIPDEKYLLRMIRVSNLNPGCMAVCFTKKYEIVNRHHDEIPRNLKIIFSVWRGLDCDNPYKFPEAHVLYKDGFTTAKRSALKCNNNCSNCAVTNKGCWTLKSGEQVVFKEH